MVLFKLIAAAGDVFMSTDSAGAVSLQEGPTVPFGYTKLARIEKRYDEQARSRAIVCPGSHPEMFEAKIAPLCSSISEYCNLEHAAGSVSGTAHVNVTFVEPVGM